MDRDDRDALDRGAADCDGGMGASEENTGQLGHYEVVVAFYLPFLQLVV